MPDGGAIHVALDAHESGVRLTLRDTGNPTALLALWAVGGLLAVGDLMRGRIHALSIRAFSPDEV